MSTCYVCCYCGEKEVKLWRPFGEDCPLICAECAQKRQSKCEYPEYSFSKNNEGAYQATPTGNTFTDPKWEIDDNGTIPTYEKSATSNEATGRTDQLIVDLSREAIHVTLIPAVSDKYGNFYTYANITTEAYKKWLQLPTRKEK